VHAHAFSIVIQKLKWGKAAIHANPEVAVQCEYVGEGKQDKAAQQQRCNAV
jgi:hypothetical protein